VKNKQPISPNNRISYFPDFDVLRGIAAMGVVFFHIAHWLKLPNSNFYSSLITIFTFNGQGGETSVRFFFTLSGFLITYLIFKEQEKTNSFSIWKFYMRRLLRIWPLYFLTLLIGFILYPYLSIVLNRPYTETAEWFYYATFLANFNSYSSGYALGILGVQWSVAIEEQFYLFWPLLCVLFRYKKFVVLSILLFLASNIFMGYYRADENYVYFHTISALNELASGGLAAYLAFYHWPTLQKILKKISKPLIFFIYCLGLISIFFNREIFTEMFGLVYLKKIIPTLFFVFILLEQSFSKHSLFKMRHLNWFQYLGKISYGIYLLHMVAIHFVLGLVSFMPIPVPLQIILVLVVTILFSHLSYHYFEAFFLRLKHKFIV